MNNNTNNTPQDLPAATVALTRRGCQPRRSPPPPPVMTRILYDLVFLSLL